MSKHVHNWILINHSNSRDIKPKAPETNIYVRTGGLFGGGYISSGRPYQSILEDIVETIESGNNPTYSSEKWACECGKTKVNFHTHPSLNSRINGIGKKTK